MQANVEILVPNRIKSYRLISFENTLIDCAMLVALKKKEDTKNWTNKKVSVSNNRQMKLNNTDTWNNRVQDVLLLCTAGCTSWIDVESWNMNYFISNLCSLCSRWEEFNFRNLELKAPYINRNSLSLTCIVHGVVLLLVNFSLCNFQ